MRKRVALVALLALSFLAMGNGRPPWHARRRPHPPPNRLATARVLVEDWPDEPASPRRVDPARFAQALRRICGGGPQERSERYARYVLESAATFTVDPFLLAALIYREGRCRYDAENGERGSGVGLTLIDPRMYAENVRRGRLSYRVREGGRWVERERALDRFPFGEPRLRVPEANIYFAAGLLGMWRDQHEAIDEAFENVAHRHYVSHFVWGDRVRSDRPEDQILTERRRLLELYGEAPSARPIVWEGVTFTCPLHGCPRVVTSYLGSEREDGSRHHRGVDVESLPGEEVLAVAPGTVVFAGVDLPGAQQHQQLRSMAEFEAVPRSALAAGGRYVCVRHRRPGDLPNVRSCYMHLDEVRVRYGDELAAGAVIGTVGRTGMQTSAAHLHLELHTDRLEDPSQILAGLLLGHRETDPLPRRRRR
ncbi:MAG: M23 family metallopeptidase [Sandaracinaceae bacterium]|nr:M23 family metallopeptidase [Sandaracinaceae bacterium]